MRLVVLECICGCKRRANADFYELDVLSVLAFNALVAVFLFLLFELFCEVLRLVC